MQQDGSGLSRRAALLGLVALTAFGAWVRTREMGALLPVMLEPDADYVRQALVLRAHRLGRLADLSSMLPDYPLLLPWLLSWLPLEPTPPALAAAPAQHLQAAGSAFLLGRWLVALLSIAIVPGTYLMSRALLSRTASLLASAFAATSLVHVLYAQQARPHGAFVALLALALVACLHLERRGSPSAHLLAGIACGLAIACLHFGVFLVPALCLAAWTAPGRRVWKFVLALVPVGLAILWAYPMLFAASSLGADGGDLKLTGHSLGLEKFGGRGFLITPWLAWSHEPVLTLLVFVAALWGAARLLARRALVPRPSRGALLVLAAFGVPYFLVLGAFDYSWDKYGLPLLPLVCLFAAAVVERIALRWLPSRTARVGLSVVVLALPTSASARFALLRTEPDSTERAAAWIEAHLERETDTILLSHTLSLPLVRVPPRPDRVPSWALSPWNLYLRRRAGLAGRPDAWRLHHLYVLPPGVSGKRAVLEHDGLLRAIRASGAGWMVLERRGSWQAPNDHTRAAVQSAGGELVASFEPFDPERVTLDSRGYMLGNQAVLRALTASYSGPRIEVWRLPR